MMRTLSILLAGHLAICPAQEQKGTSERIKVHGNSLEGNLSGDSPDRDVSVYLPASYAKEKKRRYPVVYFLHGFTDSDEKWFWNEKHFVNLPKALDAAITRGSAEMIVVMPNAFTKFQGSGYSTSVTIGDWETYVARELVAYIDSHYRTIPSRESRGLAGHSMGGYGTLRIGMKKPDVFAALYALSSCCMSINSAALSSQDLSHVKTVEDAAKLGFGSKAALAGAAGWSPNPKNPPFFLDLLVKDGQRQPEVQARWTSNLPLSIVDQYITQLRRYKAIAFDVGNKDTTFAPDVSAFHDKLEAYGLAHEFEVYDGNHVNRVAERIEKSVMPFFTKYLDAGQKKR